MRTEQDGLHLLEVYECPIEVLEAVARAAGVNVTVENVRPVRATSQWFEAMQAIDPERAAGPSPSASQARTDVSSYGP